MKYFFYLLALCVATSGFSQETPATIAGSYRIVGNSPEGGSSIVVMPNNTFVVAYFGGMLKGTWEHTSGIYFFKYHTEPKFVLYGRVNPNIKDSISVNIGIDGHKGVALQFNRTSKMPFTKLFNDDSNCYDYPYTYKQPEALRSVAIYTLDRQAHYKDKVHELPELYNFTVTDLYNEFILTGLSEEYSTPGSFNATYTDGVLKIKGGKDLKKGRSYEEMGEEDLAFVKRYTSNEIFPMVLQYGSEFFPYYDNPSDSDLIPFTRIDAKIGRAKDIELLDKSLFIARCED